MGKSDVGTPGFNDGTELGHRRGLWFGRVWKRRCRIVVQREHFATEHFEPLRTRHRTRAIAAIDGYDQPPSANHIYGERFLQRLNIVRNRIGVINRKFDLFPVGLAKFSLMEDVEQFFRLRRIEIKTVAADKLEGVPAPRIMAGRDRDAAVRLE